MTGFCVGLDLDGTLLNSFTRHGQALKQAADNIGIDLPDFLVANFASLKKEGGSGVEVLLQHGIPEAKELMTEWVGVIEKEDLLVTDTLYPGVRDVLKRNTKRGMRFFIVTSRQFPARVKWQIKTLGLGALVEDALVVAPGGAGKGDVSAPLNLSAVIGDTENDSKWAMDLGTDFFPVHYGFRSEAYWSSRGIRSYSSLDNVFKEIVESCRPGGRLR